MHVIGSLLLISTCLMSAPAAAIAQSLEPGGTGVVLLTLGDAVEQALARNRDLAVARRDVDVNRGRLEQARRYPFNPVLELGGDAGSGTGTEAPRERRGIGSGSVALAQVVEIQGQRGIRTSAAEADLSRAQWVARDAERQVIGETAKAFSGLRLAQERLRLAQDVVALFQGLKDTAERLVQAGEVPAVDALRAEIELRRATNRLTLEEAALAAARRGLALLVGADPEAPLVATGPVFFDPVPGTLGDLLAYARRNRPDLKAAESALESARAALRLVEVERFVPSLLVSAGYGETVDFDNTNRRGLLSLSIPLPLWNRREGDRQAAEGEVRRQEAQRARILAQIETDVPTAFQQFTAANRVVAEFEQRVVPGQEETARLIREGYRLGEFRLTDALLAQRDFVETRTAYLDAVAAANAARADLQRGVGVRP